MSVATDFRAKAQQLLDRIASSNSAELAKLGFATIRPFQVGVTKVFLKDPLMQLLETKLQEKLRAYVQHAQKRWRGMKARRMYAELKQGCKVAQTLARTAIARKRFLDLRARHQATTLMQALARTRVARRTFTGLRRAAVMIQKFARGWWIRRSIGKLKSKAAADKVRKLREEELRQEELRRSKEEQAALRAQLEAQQEAVEN